MAISFACESCNKKYKVDDKLAGKRATCKGCGTTMQIPGGTPARALAPARVPPATRPVEAAEPDFDSLFAMAQAEAVSEPSRTSLSPSKEAGGYCPECRASMLAGTRICVRCGFDVRLGKKMATQVQVAEPADDSPPLRNRPVAGRGSSGGGGSGLVRFFAVGLTVIGIAASLLPLANIQLRMLMNAGSTAPMVGCGLGLLGAVLFFVNGNPGGGVFSGGAVLAAFAVCMAVDPYAKFRAQEAAAAAAASDRQGSHPANSLLEEQMRELNARAEARREAARQEDERRLAEMKAAAQRRQEEFAARNSQLNGGMVGISGGGTSLVPAYIPPPPPRQLPSDPVDRDLFLLQSGQRSERITAGAHLLANPPKGRIDEVAAAFRGLVREEDVSLRRQSIPGMLLVGTDENVPALVSLLGDTSAEIRTAAIKVLAKLKDERALEPLLNRLAVDTDETLEAVRPFADRIEPLLIAKLKEGDKDAKLAAARGLLVYGTPAALPQLRLAAKDPEAPVATAARVVWKKLAPGELDPLTEALFDLENDALADPALTRLAAMQPDEKRREAVVAALTPMLQGRQIDVSRVAVALLNWQGKDAVPALLPLLGTVEADRKPKLARALAKTGEPQVATVLAEWMTSNSDRGTAAVLLGEMGPAAEEAVLGMLFVDDPQLAPLTLGLLDKVGTPKSLRQLRMFSAKVQNPQLARQAEGVANNIEKRRQAELREQRLRPTTLPATKKAAT